MVDSRRPICRSATAGLEPITVVRTLFGNRPVLTGAAIQARRTMQLVEPALSAEHTGPQSFSGDGGPYFIPSARK